MNITLNGEAKTLPSHCSLLQMLNELELKLTNVAVVINEQVVPRSQWEETSLKGHDRIEIFSAVAGG